MAQRLYLASPQGRHSLGPIAYHHETHLLHPGTLQHPLHHGVRKSAPFIHTDLAAAQVLGGTVVG